MAASIRQRLPVRELQVYSRGSSDSYGYPVAEYDKRVTKEMPFSNVSFSTGDGLELGEGVGAGLRNMDLVHSSYMAVLLVLRRWQTPNFESCEHRVS